MPKPAMDGVLPVPVVVELTLTVTVAVALAEPLGLYVAVMVALPTGSCEPRTTSVAVAVPAEPTSAADPSGVDPALNVTEPDGVDPFAPATLAVRYVMSVALRLRRLESSEILVVPDDGTPAQAMASLNTSKEPSPVTLS